MLEWIQVFSLESGRAWSSQLLLHWLFLKVNERLMSLNIRFLRSNLKQVLLYPYVLLRKTPQYNCSVELYKVM